MNQHLQNILNTIQEDKNLSEEEKNVIIKSLKDADKEFEIANFKLDRTEKVKRTTAILLEETIEELEQKRKAVEAQNKELEIESSLERVRAVAMSMMKADDLLRICEVQFNELKQLGFTKIRNALIGIFNDEKNYFTDYDYSDFAGGNIHTIPYNKNSLVDRAIMRMKSANNAFTEFIVEGDELEEWKAFRKTNGEYDDIRITDTKSLYYYFYSIESGNIGISTLEKITEKQLNILKRFRNVFDLAYKRYVDISKAAAQAKEAQIETALEKVRSRSMGMQKSEELKEVIQVVYEQLIHLNIKLDHAGFVVDYKPTGDWHFWIADSQEIPSKITHPYFDSIWAKQFDEAKEKGKEIFTTHLNFEEKNKFYQELFNYIPGLPEQSKEFYFSKPGLDASTVLMEDVGLYIENFDAIPYTDEENNTLMRFGKVFQQTYTRFLDLQKAEEQAKEAQVEAALEKVRSRSLAMHKSDELQEVVTVVFERLNTLNIDTNVASIFIFKDGSKDWEQWVASADTNYSNYFHLPYLDNAIFNDLENAKESRKDFYNIIYSKEQKNEWFNYAFVHTEYNRIPDARKKFLIACDFYNVAFALSKNTGLQLAKYAGADFSEKDKDILKRFSKVFEQAYVRFLDLQKAEAQSRESQIQLALERARSQSMIMQHSNELDDTLRVFHEQVLLLNIPSAFSFLWLPDEENDKHIFWAAWKEEKNGSSDFKSKAINYPLDRNEPATAQCLIDWKGNEPIVSYHVLPSGVENYFAAWQELIDGVEQLKPEYFTGGLYYVEAFMKYGCFGVMVVNDLTNDEKNILERFATEFERTYQRFLDLQKAEAQAREAQIEASLERVRSKTMAMHNSQDVGDTVAGLFDEYGKLGIETFRCGIGIIHQEKRMEVWTAKRDANGKINFFTGYMDMTMHPMLQGCYSALKKKNDAYTYELEGNDLKEYFSRINSNPEYQLKYDISSLPSRLIFSVFYFPEGLLFAFTKEELTAEATRTFKRFCGVFGQTYRRYLDLQKAEAQAREAQIEASLERVRSKAMSMQKSEDLAAAITIVFEELDKLDLGMLRCGIGILNKEKRTADVYSTTIADNDNVIQVSGDESMDIHPLLSGAFDAWLNHEDHSYTLKGDDLTNYYKAVAGENFKLPDSQSLVTGTEITQYYYNAVWASGGLFAFRETPFPEEAKTILRRFADVFTLTYTRFTDLKQAEAQAKEARIEVALERVRSRTLAMQRSDELAETAAVLFQQLIALGIEPNRLYISIVKNDQGDAEFWITDEDGSKISTAFSANLNDNPTFIKMYTGWKQQLRSLVIDMHGEELEMYFRHLTSIGVPFKGGLTQKRRLQDIAYFSKGFIGMASPDEQPDETINLLERFAAVFNLTFTRFNDLKVAEAHAIQAEEDLIKLQTEKKRAEDALAELQVTQKQLIQSEKMASLGELTAGIAHEIQNPLNFVNNFSEVSNELIDEMNAEIEKGDMEEAKAIANDIKQNLEKINHHGKRADAIVKGMLQHSRSSTSTKEPTDINKLADEYLRLAYHGLRAKDKSFNATLKTDYDEIGNINIIPQDIGRVILNLITNAFYVVNEKNLSAVSTTLSAALAPTAVKYEPTVSVSTKKIDDKVEIKVSDNGNGIPQKILDKIFQPFFTTKPTGQGTGLGLSLSYDIVKAHGGELKVNTKENEGTEFIIQLPTT